jgi:hypothetical protein
MIRREILDLCSRANTIAEVRAAQEARSRWLADHPEDIAVRDMGEMLAMLEEGFTLKEREAEERPLFTVDSLAVKAS